MASAAVFEAVACEADGDETTEIKSPSGCRFVGEEAEAAAAVTAPAAEQKEEAAEGAILFLFILRFLVWMLSFLSVMGRGHCNREREMMLIPRNFRGENNERPTGIYDLILHHEPSAATQMGSILATQRGAVSGQRQRARGGGGGEQ